MKYISTRGGVPPTTYEETLFTGYARDGGLYVPQENITLDNITLDAWKNANLSYPEVVKNVVRLFVSEEEMPNEDLEISVANAYAKFNIKEVIGLKELTTSSGKPFTLAQLYHGRTASFKDYAMALVGQFLEYFSLKRQSHSVILVGTSGDTGSAAIETVKGLKSVDIIVMFPKGKISPVQELQMTSTLDDNVHVYQVEGTSDDIDVPIKACFPSAGVTSINSISWTRVMIQIAHYIYLYLQEGEEVDIFVPTGAGGNIVAGYMARLMGVPINLYAATNENDNVEMLLNAGVYRMGGVVLQTPANAMDIRYPYNAERIIYFASDSQTVVRIVNEEENGRESVMIPDEIRKIINGIIKGCFKVETPLIYETMKSCWENNEFMICPHTATAVAYFDKLVSSNLRKTYVISTASPFKFPESSEEAGIPCEKWNGYQLRDALVKTPKIVPRTMLKKDEEEWSQILKAKISEILTSKNNVIN